MGAKSVAVQLTGITITGPNGNRFTARWAIMDIEQGCPRITLQQWPDGHKRAPGLSLTLHDTYGLCTMLQLGALIAHPSMFLDMTKKERDGRMVGEWIVHGCFYKAESIHGATLEEPAA